MNSELPNTTHPESASETRAMPVGASKPSVFIKTFGCLMNEYDAEKIYHLLTPTHRAVSEINSAEVVIVNTCSVREKGEQKLFSLLGELRDRKTLEPNLIIGVTGCVAQQEGDKIMKRNRAVDFVVGTHNLSLVPSLVSRAHAGEKSVAVNYREEWEELPEEFDSVPVLPTEHESGVAPLHGYLTPVRAMVAIQRGCNKKCAFCVVPTTRGPEVSRNPAEVLREIKLKVRLGAREVMLLGQTVNSYGRDLEPRYPFSRLIRDIASIEGLERIRFTSPHPADVRPDFIELYGDIPQLMPQIHLPLQSGNNRVLKAMNRNYKIERYLEIIEQLRARVPQIGLTTDIIVGFPTETDEEFEDTINVMRATSFDAAYYFKYSIRPNTVAGELYGPKDQVSREVVSERFQRLKLLQNEISLARNALKVGKVDEMLVEGQSKQVSSFLRGRLPDNTLVEAELPLEMIGRTVRVLITESGPQMLRAKPELQI